jgi:hypothetical protein
MLRITTNEIKVVPVGTDDVILLDPEDRVWPSYEEVLKPLIDEIAPVLGSTCTKLIPKLPLTQHLTTRWSTSSRLSVEQMRQIFIGGGGSSILALEKSGSSTVGMPASWEVNVRSKGPFMGSL